MVKCFGKTAHIIKERGIMEYRKEKESFDFKMVPLRLVFSQIISMWAPQSLHHLIIGLETLALNFLIAIKRINLLTLFDDRNEEIARRKSTKICLEVSTELIKI